MKRRSGRNTKRKKYVDDVEYNFSDEDLKGLNKADAAAASTAAIDDILGPLKDGSLGDAGSTENSLLPDGDPYNPSQAGPNYAFIDPTAEDTMIVQYILTSRVGVRELEDSEVSKILEVLKLFPSFDAICCV